MVDLLKRWLLRFAKQESLPHPIWDTNVDDPSIWLGPYNISIGETARLIFNDLSADKQSFVLEQIRKFFKKGTQKLIDYLPFNNELLVGCQFLDPKNVSSPQFEGWVKTTAAALPSAIKNSDLSTLEVEVRLLQSSMDENPQDKPEEFWERKNEQVPHLSRLARQAMILPHGNAEVERVFSMLPDIVTKKRSRLQYAL